MNKVKSKDQVDENGIKKRKFNQTSFDDVDMKSKNRTLQLFTDLGYKVGLNPNPFEVDVIVYNEDNSIKAYIEVECRKNFTEIMTKYDNIFIPERKRKFFELDKPTTYICWSYDLTQYYIIKGSVIKTCPSEKVIDPQKRFYDIMFIIPKNLLKFYKYENPSKWL